MASPATLTSILTASLRLSVVPGQVRALYDAIVAAPSLVSDVLHVWDEMDSHDLFTDVDMQVVQDFDQFTSGAESFEAAFGKSPHAFVTEDLGMTGVSISLGSDHCDDAIESCATLSIHLDGDNMLHDVIDAFPEVDLHFPGGHAGRFMTHKDDGMYGDTTLDIVGGIDMQPHRLASYVMDGFSNVATSGDDDVQVLDLVFGVGDLLPHQWAGLYDLVSVVLTRRLQLVLTGGLALVLPVVLVSILLMRLSMLLTQTAMDASILKNSAILSKVVHKELNLFSFFLCSLDLEQGVLPDLLVERSGGFLWFAPSQNHYVQVQFWPFSLKYRESRPVNEHGGLPCY